MGLLGNIGNFIKGEGSTPVGDAALAAQAEKTAETMAATAPPASTGELPSQDVPGMGMEPTLPKMVNDVSGPTESGASDMNGVVNPIILSETPEPAKLDEMTVPEGATPIEINKPEMNISGHEAQPGPIDITLSPTNPSGVTTMNEGADGVKEETVPGDAPAPEDTPPPEEPGAVLPFANVTAGDDLLQALEDHRASTSPEPTLEGNETSAESPMTRLESGNEAPSEEHKPDGSISESPPVSLAEVVKKDPEEVTIHELVASRKSQIEELKTKEAANTQIIAEGKRAEAENEEYAREIAVLLQQVERLEHVGDEISNILNYEHQDSAA